ncbi:MAG: divalent-cation tolerance protein CutA [bacterium]
MAEEIIIFVTAGSHEEAQNIANELVERRLAACVNIVDAVNSVFNWQGKVCQEDETLMMIKSVRSHLTDLITRIKALHSYEVPEIIAIPIIAGSQDYLDWIQQETRSG